MQNKFIVYQLLPRLFGNSVLNPVLNGNRKENGCGTLDDLNETAINSIKKLGVTHIWMTGILQHGSTTDYSSLSTPLVHPATVKGKAGSPYAITDFFELDPDLFSQPEQRWESFEKCLKRVQKAGMKVIIDFIPNHTARQYFHPAKRAKGIDLGQQDNVNQAFSPHNNYYYVPGEPLHLPNNYPDKKGLLFEEKPAKATGNDCFHSHPSEFDWYETVKLNYGHHPETGEKHFDPIPGTWHYMLEVLMFWSSKGIDGFRCDMVEMVPVEFWCWALPKVREVFPHLIFIAEVYNPVHYHAFLFEAGFDFLYDKVDLYDQLILLLKGRGHANDLSKVWQKQEGFGHRMLRFMENHDEQRLACSEIAGNGHSALPAFVLTALFDRAPVMVYAGQEFGEPATGSSGFSGDDGKTTIFDYWNIPSVVRWNSGGNWDGKNLLLEEKELQEAYKIILNLALHQVAFSKGHFYDLQFSNQTNNYYPAEKLYSFLRYFVNEVFLVACHFGSADIFPRIIIPENAWNCLQLPIKEWYQWEDMMNGEKMEFYAQSCFEADGGSAGLVLPISKYGFRILKISNQS